MKDLLFVLPSMNAGGTRTSLLNLVELMNEHGAKADIFLLEHSGNFMERARRTNHLLPEEKIISSVLCSKSNLHSRGVLASLIRIAYSLSSKMIGIERARKCFMCMSAKKLSNQYHTVVAFQESITTEYVGYIDAGNRVAWVHSNYTEFSKYSNKKHIVDTYKKYQDVVCVSAYLKICLCENLPIPSTNIHIIKNVIPSTQIVQQSNQKTQLGIKTSDFMFISMGRFSKVKCFERVIQAADELCKQQIDFTWYILGDGEEYSNISKMVNDYNLQDKVILPGVQENPFPLLKHADCFVLTSQSEAQPMVLNEALTLGVPVISTDFSSAHEVVEDGVFGLIVENSTEGVIDGVNRFISDEALRKKLTDGAKHFEYDNETILKQVMALVK